MRWKKRRFEDDEDDFGFGFFDRWIEEEFRRMDEWMEEILRNFRELGKKGEIRGPYVYGFTMRVGPDGKPQIEEFGNVPRKFGVREEGIAEYREPLTDVIEGDKTISVTVELPGVNKEDIDVEITEDTITIKVDTADRKYYKEIQLPDKVKTDTARASYHNGVLDIVLERKEPKKKKGKKLKIE